MLKSEKITVCVAMGAFWPLFHKKIRLPDLACDVLCISTNVQDDEPLDLFNQNISRNKADVKIL